jgi:hypothetical protein
MIIINTRTRARIKMAPEREPRLDSLHRATVEKIFGHPTSHNVQWHDVISLLESVGSDTGP